MPPFRAPAAVAKTGFLLIALVLLRCFWSKSSFARTFATGFSTGGAVKHQQSRGLPEDPRPLRPQPPGAAAMVAAAWAAAAALGVRLPRFVRPQTCRHALPRRSSELVAAASVAPSAPDPAAAAAVAAELSAMAREERRLNPWDGNVYTFEELERVLGRGDLTNAEIEEHWKERCRPLTASGEVRRAPQVAAWEKMFTVNSMTRMWTAADTAHVHAVSGALYAILGAAFLFDTSMHDLAPALWAQHFPLEAGMACLAIGTVNALSGLQPSLLTRSRADLLRVLGLGADGDLKSGGFMNTTIFYLVLVYQSFRAFPSFPAALEPLDSAVALLTILLVLHQAFILNAWVGKGAMHRVDAFLVPGMFNLPVSIHLLTQGQVWIDQLSWRFLGFPELFFFTNFALAWSCAMVTFALSLYERRVISLELRGLLMLALPAAVFVTAFIRAGALVPQWFGNDFLVMLSLNP